MIVRWHRLLPPEIRTRCALDLLRFFYRHPNTYMTVEALSMRVGYVATDVEAEIDALTRAGLILQHRRDSLGTVLYQLVAEGFPSSVASLTFTSRWRRQALRIAEARERRGRADVLTTRSDDRVARTTALLARIHATRRVARDA